MLCMEQEYSFLWTLKRTNPGFYFVLADEKMSFCSEGGLVLQIKFVSSFRHSFFFFSSSSSSSTSPTPLNKQLNSLAICNTHAGVKRQLLKRM